MHASIIVCTYNRAESLDDTLGALRELQVPPGCKWEVIVVDNNSIDGTRALVKTAARSWPQLRYEFEGAQGLSHARNHGIACASGEIVLFTDDDVLPEPDWLAVTLAGMARHQSDACGGFIAPIWESPPPPWLTERFFGFLAIRTDRTDDFTVADVSDAPFGANMAFRREVFAKVGTFDTTRGRKGQVLSSGEDIELFDRLISAGLKVHFLGQSKVHHKVEAYRLKKSYFRRWRWQTSRNIAISNGVFGDRRLFNIPYYLYPQLSRALAQSLLSRFRRDESNSLHRDMIACHFLGTFQGLWKMRHEARPSTET